MKKMRTQSELDAVCPPAAAGVRLGGTVSARQCGTRQSDHQQVFFVPVVFTTTRVGTEKGSRERCVLSTVDRRSRRRR